VADVTIALEIHCGSAGSAVADGIQARLMPPRVPKRPALHQNVDVCRHVSPNVSDLGQKWNVCRHVSLNVQGAPGLTLDDRPLGRSAAGQPAGWATA
jgi:hypothetical protein